MGIDTDRVVNDAIDDGLICSICSELLENPLMVDICEHTYCSNCINDWLQINKTCPQDRINICTKQLVSIPRYMKNQINKLRVKCCFSTNGCPFESSLDILEDHEKDCLFNEINTRITRKVEDQLKLDATLLTRITKYRHKYEYQVIRCSMSEEMKKMAVKLSKEALYLCGRVNLGLISAYIKTHLEPNQNKYWHCIAGTDYDCLLTANHFFIIIKIDGIYIIAFKTK